MYCNIIKNVEIYTKNNKNVDKMTNIVYNKKIR